MIPKLFILCVDGLSADIVLESDHFDFTKDLCRQQEHAVVHSPNNLANPDFPFPHTWPAFASMWTGVGEEDHGIRMPDRDKEIVQKITDQPYKTVWEILDDAGYKCALGNVRMAEGLKLNNGVNLKLRALTHIDLFTITSEIASHMRTLREYAESGFDVICYYTYMLDYWFHRKMLIRDRLIYQFLDYLIEWCQWHCTSMNFIVLSDHGFDPVAKKHTNNAFYFSRRQGGRVEGLELKDLAKIILGHVDSSLSAFIGQKVDRTDLPLSREEKAVVLKRLEGMGYF